MADNRDPVLKFLVDIGVDPKKFTKEVRAALQEAAKFIRSQNNYITAASREAFEKAGKEAAKSYYKGFNSIRPQYKVQGPTAAPTSRSVSRRSASTPAAPTELPPPPPPIAAPPSRATTAQDQAALAAINARIDAELRAIEVREFAAQRVKELAAQEAAAERKATEQKIKDTQRELAAQQKVEAARARAIAQEAAAQQRQAAAREAAIKRELAADARLVASIDRNRQMQEKRQQQLLQREIVLRERAAKAAEKQAAQVAAAERKQNQILQREIQKRERAAARSSGRGGTTPPVTPSAAAPATGGGDRLAQEVSNFKNTAAAVVGLYASLSTLLDIYKRVTDAAIEFSKVQFQLQVNVRANQRLYGVQAGTIAEWRSEVERLRATYGVFSRQDLTSAISQVQTLTRQYGFSRKQTLDLVEVAAQLAETYGTDIGSALSQATSFLQGNSRALEAYSIDASEASFRTQAVKDDILELGAGWDSLSDAEKALARYNFLLQQTAPLADDAAKAQETFGGQLQAAKARQDELLASIGERLAGPRLFWEQFLTNALQVVDGIVGYAAQGYAALVAFSTAAAEQITASLQAPLNAIYAMREELGGSLDQFAADLTSGKNINEAFAGFYERALDAAEAGAAAFRDTQVSVTNFGDTFKKTYEEVVKSIGISNMELGDTEKSMDAINSKAEQVKRTMQDLAMDAAGDVEEILSDNAKARAEAARDFIESYQELMRKRFEDEARAAREHGQRLEELERELAEGREEAARDYWDRIGEIERDGAQEREEAARDYAQDLIELERDLAKDRQDAARDYSDRIADIDREEARRVAEIDAERNREREREEEDHQRELQRIRERYAIQIDEAVQRRDARAILNLQRQRAQDLKEAEEDFGARRRREDEDAEERKRKAREEADERRADAKRDYDRRLRDLEEAEAEKRRELREGYEKELEDQKRSEAEKRAEALRDYQRKMEDLQRSNAQKRQELQRDYQQQLADMRQASLQQETELRNSYIRRKADLEAALREQFIRLGKHWADTGKLNEAGAKYVTDVLNYYFGLGGLADYIMQGFIARARGRAEIEVRTSGFGAAPTTPSPDDPGTNRPHGGPVNAIGMAHGGVLLANGPTNVVMGEAGRELALFMPLAQAGLFASQQGKNQRIDIDLHLNVDGRTDFFSTEFEDRVAEVIANAYEQAMRD